MGQDPQGKVSRQEIEEKWGIHMMISLVFFKSTLILVLVSRDAGGSVQRRAEVTKGRGAGGGTQLTSKRQRDGGGGL